MAYLFSPTPKPSVLVIPSVLENIFNNGNEAAQNEFEQFKCKGILDLFIISYEDNKFKFKFNETGIAYGNTEISSLEVKNEIDIKTTDVDFTASLITGVRLECGVNFAATIEIKHINYISVILIPGTRTYDPAGITGDPHCSERIGPDCSRFNFKLTYLAVTAAINGASFEGVCNIFDTFYLANKTYHGRIFLANYMKKQIKNAIYDKNEVILQYPALILNAIDENEINLTDHLKEYLNSSTDIHNCIPPAHFYRKIQAKDVNIETILGPKNYAKFLTLVV